MSLEIKACYFRRVCCLHAEVIEGICGELLIEVNYYTQWWPICIRKNYLKLSHLYSLIQMIRSCSLTASPATTELSLMTDRNNHSILLTYLCFDPNPSQQIYILWPTWLPPTKYTYTLCIESSSASDFIVYLIVWRIIL